MTLDEAMKELSCNCRENDSKDRQIIKALASQLIALQNALAALQEDLCFLKAAEARRAQSAAERFLGDQDEFCRQVTQARHPS